MNNYVIFTDSSIDMSYEYQKSHEEYLKVIPFGFRIDGKDYKNYLDHRQLPIEEFYNRLKNGSRSTTSQINQSEFCEEFEKVLEKELDIFYIGFSSALSGTVNCALIAKDELLSKYPDRKIFVVDSLCASMGEGLFVDCCINKYNEGATIEELYEYAENLKLNICHWFTVGDLNFLKRGGRLSAGKATIGTLLNIKPVLHTDNNGRLVPMSNVRGRKAAIKAIFDKLETAIDPVNDKIFISHCDCIDDANTLKSLIVDKYHPKNDIMINEIGPVISSHCGNGTLAVFFIGKER